MEYVIKRHSHVIALLGSKAKLAKKLLVAIHVENTVLALLMTRVLLQNANVILVTLVVYATKHATVMIAVFVACHLKVYQNASNVMLDTAGNIAKNNALINVVVMVNVTVQANAHATKDL